MPVRVWLITGSNSGLGLALAQYALSQGDNVIAAVRDISKIPESLRAAKHVSLDLNASHVEIVAVATQALEFYGKVDVLVNNAGYGGTGAVEELDIGAVKAEFQTNVFGGLSLTQGLLPSFRAQKSGHIVNVSSTGAFVQFPSFGAYSASKAALEAFSETLSKEVAPFGIRVLIIEPGYFHTNIISKTSALEPPPDRILPDVYPANMRGPVRGRLILEHSLKHGHIGDPDKAAARIFEVVTDTGLAAELVEGWGTKREWLRVPLGADCGEALMDKFNLMKENFEIMEPIWRSTDHDVETVEAIARAAGL